MEGLIGKEKWRATKDKVQAFVKRAPIVGKATSKILTKVSQADRKIKDREGKNVGIGVKKGKVSVKNPIKSAEYVAKSFSVTKKEKNNKGTTKVLKATKQYERFDDELDADEKDNVLDNIIKQNTRNVLNGGTSYTKNLFTKEKIEAFISNPDIPVNEITYEYSGMILDDLVLVGRDVYHDENLDYRDEYSFYVNEDERFKRAWDTEIGGTYIAPSKREFLILDRVSYPSGMDAVVLKDKINGNVKIAFQGSTPGIDYIIKPQNWTITGMRDYITDWGNNAANATELQKYFRIFNDNSMKPTLFNGSVLGTTRQQEDALEYTQKIISKYGSSVKKLGGHSLGGSNSIYAGSYTGLSSYGVDPAPVNNPGKYIHSGNTVVFVPDYGNGLLNKSIYENGKKTYEFNPMRVPALGIGGAVKGIPVFDQMGVDGMNNHEPNYDDIRITEHTLKEFYMTLEAVK